MKNTDHLHSLQGPTNCSILQSREGEHGKDGKHQPQDLKHSIYDSKHSFCHPDDSKHSILRHMWRRSEKLLLRRCENMIPVQLKMGEHQAICGALILCHCFSRKHISIL